MAPDAAVKVQAPHSYAHLIFRSASGSLTWESYRTIATGTFLAVSSVVQFLGRMPDRWVSIHPGSASSERAGR